MLDALDAVQRVSGSDQAVLTGACAGGGLRTLADSPGTYVFGT